MSPGPSLTVALARSFVVLGGLGVGVWALEAGQFAWRHAGLSNAAMQVESQETFTDDRFRTLEPQLEAVEAEPSCAPTALHDVAVIRLRLAETAMLGGKRLEIDPALHQLDAVTRKGLQCSPMDPFLWLALYWVEIQLNGARGDAVGPLEMSYRLGPNEGWIALRRSRYGLAAYDYVSPATRAAILDEERALLDAGLVREVADNLTASGLAIRDLILARLSAAKPESREALAHVLRRDGREMPVPGIVLNDARPWD